MKFINKRKKVFRRCLMVLFIMGLASLGGLFVYDIKAKIPDRITVTAGEEENLNLDLPVEAVLEEESVLTFSGSKTVKNGKIHLNLSEEITVSSDTIGDTSFLCKLWGVIPIKEVEVASVNEKALIPCGQPVGIYIHTPGVMVIGTGSVTGTDGMEYEPAAQKIQSGDYIMEVDGETVSNKRELIRSIKNAENETVVLTVLRNAETVKIRLERIQTGTDEYKLGIWVREDTQGVGMLTYVDENGNFGALGHSINDPDTGDLMEAKSGNIMESRIVSITKGESGSPGELVGVIRYGELYNLGSIEKNTEEGIFGNGGTALYQFAQEEGIGALPVGYRQNVETGPAVICCNIDGNLKEYDIEIIGIKLNEKKLNKEIVLKVTDPELIEATGGIVQGMSGSPIIQNGKIIGAVTHVLVNDPTRGYGIFIENMLEH